MIDVAFTFLRQLAPRPRRHLLSFMALSLTATALDLLLVLGMLGFARLLINALPMSYGPDWISTRLGERSSPELTVVAAVGGLLVLSLVKTGVQLRAIMVRHRLLVPLVRTLVRGLFVQELAIPYKSRPERNVSAVAALLIEDIRLSVQHVLTPLLDSLPDVVLGLSMMTVLLVIDPGITAILALSFAVSAGLQVLLTRKFYRLQKQVAREIIPGLLEVTTQALSAAKEIKVMGRELGFRRRMRHASDRYARALGNEGFSNTLPRLWNESFLFLCLAILAGMMVLSGRELDKTIPLLALFSAAGWRLLPLSNRMLRAAAQIRPHLPIARDLLARWARADAPSRRTAILEPQAIFTTAIRLRALSCGYCTQAPVFSGLEAKIKRGATVAVTGCSGIGKTTLIDTLLGLLPPLGGRIEIDGRPLADVKGRWQRLLGYVPQDPYVANESIRDNVLWGLPRSRIPDARIAQVLAQVGMANFIDHLPLGLETRLGDRGMRMSGGERARLCIARAVLADPAVLVLDEATSQLDIDSEAEVLAGLRRASPGLTLILVTHRPQTAAVCDQFITLPQTGSH